MSENLSELSKLLLSKNTSISKKMRALFTLRNIHTDESASIIAQAFSDKSVLLRHELAYVLGQMRRISSVKSLIQVLEDENEDEIVRHEAGEALANYQNKDHIKILERFVTHKSTPLRETCILGIKKIGSAERCNEVSKFLSVDPAPVAKTTLEEARKHFTNSSADMYDRYKTMFFLRDLMTEDAVEVLVKGFSEESALFKHEVAFVLGQMQLEAAVPFLVRVLNDREEHDMVRHECAEALGAIGTEEARKELQPLLRSSIEILRESAEVALDICSYKMCKEDEYCLA